MSSDESGLRERLKQHGYKLIKITRFKNHDRIVFGNDKINVSLNWKGKTSEIALDALIKACIR